jgi:hypothetical protein
MGYLNKNYKYFEKPIIFPRNKRFTLACSVLERSNRLKLRLHATINRVRFVFWRIKMSAGAIIHCRFVKNKNCLTVYQTVPYNLFMARNNGHTRVQAHRGKNSGPARKTSCFAKRPFS